MRAVPITEDTLAVSPESIAVALLAANGLLGLFLLARYTGTVAPVLTGYAVHLSTAIGAFLTVGLLSPDAILYDQIAWTGSSPDQTLPVGKEGWVVVLGFVYRAFGHVPVAGLVINAIAAGLTVIVFAEIARRLGLPVGLTAWFVALLPPGILWSGLLLRESLTWLFMGLTVLGLAGLASRRRVVIDVAFVAVGFFGLYQFRGTAALIVGAAGLLAVIIARRQYLLLAAAAAAVVPFILSPLGAPLREIIDQYSLARILLSRVTLTVDASTAFPVENLLDTAAHVLLGPAPWEWATVGLALAGDSVIWIAVAVLAYRGIASSDRRLALVLLIPALALLLSLVLTSGNYGTMQRLRVQPELLLLPFAAAGVLRRRREPALVAPSRTLAG